MLWSHLGSNSSTILTTSLENGIFANSYGYSSKASLGFSPKLGCALAPYILLKKRAVGEKISTCVRSDSWETQTLGMKRRSQ